MKHIRKSMLAMALCVAASLPATAEIYTNSEGQRVECTHEQVTTQRGAHPIAGTVAGAAVGGLAGNQFGSGSGKTAATAGGAVVGGLAGRKLAEGETTTTTQEVCKPVTR